MKFPDQARYTRTVQLASTFILSECINSFPVDMLRICENHGWLVTKYSELAASQGVSIKEICAVLGSNDGLTIRQNGQYHILYNDGVLSRERMRFTIAHEVGHIYLNHLDFSETSISSELTKEQYKILENEANAFARNVLSPASIIGEFRPLFIDVDYVAKFFCISRHAAQVRMQFLETDLLYLTS